MSTEAIILDWRPAYLREAGADVSLLLLPFDTGTLLEHLQAVVRAADVAAVSVVPNFEYDDEYRRAVANVAPQVNVLPPHRLGEHVDNHEPSDLLLIVDSRYFPQRGFELRAMLRDTHNCRLVRHAIVLRQSAAGTQERVLCDRTQRVRAVRRLYDGVTQLEAAGVSCSLLSVSVARHVEDLELLCLQQLRARLALSNVPSRDLAAPAAALDLTQPGDLLALSERFLHSGEVHGNGHYRELAPNVRVGRGCDLDPTCRIYGPVVVHDGVRLDAGVTVVGPTVIGRGARVGARSTISQSIVVPGVVVPPGAAVVQRIWTSASIAAERELTATPAGEWEVPVVVSLTKERDGGAEEQGNWYAGWMSGGVKRLFDFQAALLGLLVLLPLLAVVAVLVKLTSRGPVFFAHEREGCGGRVFRCWKFRTMVDKAHLRQRELYKQNKVDGPQFKMDDDPRITRLGRWLRSTNIDELPQLYNVLRGEMSLIGPRPSPFRENQICVPWRKARLSVRPGITGLWQVCRHERGAGDFHQWIYYDMLYVRYWSIWLDLRVLAATFLTLGGRWSVPLEWMIAARRLRRPVRLPLAQPASAVSSWTDERSGRAVAPAGTLAHAS